MTESIKNIFEHNIKLIGDMDMAVYYFREQQYEEALSLVANSIDPIKLVIEAIIDNHEYFNLVTTDKVLAMLTGILEAKKHRDFILLADLLELQLINFLIGVQELIIDREEIVFNEDDYKEKINLLMEHGIGFSKELLEPIDTEILLQSGYRVEFTSCGLMTLAAENEGAKFYFHTNNRVQSEAFLLARNWYKEDKKRYIIYGFGMGYHIQALKSMAKDAEIQIYEADRNVIQLACAFADVKELLLDQKIKLIYDPELTLLNERISCLEPEDTCAIHYPSYKNIKDSEGKKRINSKLAWSEAVEAC